MFKNLNTSALGIAGSQSEIIELTLTYRFQAMDLNIADFCNRAGIYGVPYARRLIDSAKVKIGTFSLPLKLDSTQEVFAKELAALKDYATAASELGCRRAIAMLAPASDSLPYHENFEQHRSRLSEICKVLEPAGVTLGLGFQGAASLRKNKTFQFIHEIDALGLLVNMVKAPNLGLVIDLWDITASGGDLDTVQKTPVEQIVAVHLADMPEDKPLEELSEKDRLLPGQSGRVDCAGAIRILAEKSFQGPVSAMPHRSIFKNNRRDPIVKAVSAALAGVWTAAGLDASGKLRPVVETAG